MATPSLPQPGKALVSVEWLADNLSRSDVKVFESTTNIISDGHGGEKIVAEYDAFQQGHIPGARFIDLQRDLSDPNAPYPFTVPQLGAFERRLRNLGIDQDSIVVVYSASNPWWATRIWWLFHHFGLDNAYVLDGGLRQWKALGHALETGPGKPVATEGNIRIVAPRRLTVNADTLHGRLGDPQLQLVNALPPDKFSGAAEVHGRRGHIPGSINVPAGKLLDPATGLLRDPQSIAVYLEENGLLTGGRDLVCYCGGGISATQLIHALYRAGREDALLYDASLYEWAHRPELPLVRKDLQEK
ncbi:sulfurtransferase [Pseudomonas sp. S 311-6]|nr:sulfurtransferase [Pseudomonas sp. S 311-6]